MGNNQTKEDIKEEEMKNMDDNEFLNNLDTLGINFNNFNLKNDVGMSGGNGVKLNMPILGGTKTNNYDRYNVSRALYEMEKNNKMSGGSGNEITQVLANELDYIMDGGFGCSCGKNNYKCNCDNKLENKQNPLMPNNNNYLKGGEELSATSTMLNFSQNGGDLSPTSSNFNNLSSYVGGNDSSSNSSDSESSDSKSSDSESLNSKSSGSASLTSLTGGSSLNNSEKSDSEESDEESLESDEEDSKSDEESLENDEEDSDTDEEESNSNEKDLDSNKKKKNKKSKNITSSEENEDVNNSTSYRKNYINNSHSSNYSNKMNGISIFPFNSTESHNSLTDKSMRLLRRHI
jgi:hypothetical protein